MFLQLNIPSVEIDSPRSTKPLSNGKIAAIIDFLGSLTMVGSLIRKHVGADLLLVCCIMPPAFRRLPTPPPPRPTAAKQIQL